MSDYLSIEQVRCSILDEVASAQYDHLRDDVVQQIKAIPNSAKVDHGDAGLSSVWEEYKYQFQSSDSTYRDYYEQPVLAFCENAVASLPLALQQLLWLWTKQFDELWIEQETVTLSQWEPKAVVEKTYQLVQNIAMNEELLVNPEDEESRIQHEEDWRIISGEEE